MVDWKKEIKLSDLFGRKRDDAAEGVGSTEAAAEPEAPTPPVAPPEQQAPTPATPPDHPLATEVELPPAAAAAPALPPTSAPPQPQPVDAASTAAFVPEVPVEAPAVPPARAEVPAPLPGVHPPVAADELDPLLEPTEEKQSFLKREISFRRRPKEPKPKTPKQPKPERGEKRSLLKTELSFRRKPKAPPEAVAATPAGDDAPPKPKKKRGREPAARKRHKRLVGLKVGASQLAAARIANNGMPELVQVARDELADGVVVGGELREPDALAEALKAFFRANKLPRQGVRLGIANNRIGVRIFDIGGIEDPRQLENAIRYRAQEALPIPIEEAVLDYHTLDERVDEEGATTRRILLVVAYRELVDRYAAACKKAGIKLAGIDLEAFALLRALGEPRPEQAGPADAALVVVSIGHDRSTFAVSDGRVCEFTRVLDWGGSTLNVALARALDIAPSEAEPIKRALSLTPHASPTEGLTEEQDTNAREAVRRQLQTFARELVSSLQFYQNQPGSLGIGEIVLTGGTAHLDGLAEELQRLIGVQVRIGDPLARVKVGKKVKEPEQLGSLTIAIGLGIED